MRTIDLVLTNRYQDSVTLMQVAIAVRGIPGIDDASLVMGTEPNKELLREAGLLTAEGEAAGPNDLIVALRGGDEGIAAAQQQIERLLQAEAPASARQREAAPRTLAVGLEALPQANFVLISTPGVYAAAEARKALQLDRHVMIFSDHVSLEDELALKELAARRGLFLLGPDCGTAIIGGVPLGFANAVRRGSIGIVGASGTGIQEIATLIDRYGQGISHAIGTGSRDLSREIGGSATLSALAALGDDPSTSVIVLVSKPPHPDVAARVLEVAANCGKPIVVAFVGADPQSMGSAVSYGESGAPAPVFVSTLEEAARRAVELSTGTPPAVESIDMSAVREIAGRLAPQQRYVRGLFSGGTLCYEAQLILRRALGEVRSNAPLAPELALEHTSRSIGHTCLDLGADEFTTGRPHPMIDMTLRLERIKAEAADPEVAVLLLDVVLGYGAHPDPASVLAPAIEAVLAAASGRPPVVVVSVCGAHSDPQGLDVQRRRLAAAGAILASSNAAAARLAAAVAAREPQLAAPQQ
ncbi:MAG: hypothetical protein KatS3mg057_0375 [Herpetosiphonaceae bacterium]|nr:MAG: hypothetical protein KatS3mg057_0375 [Herpetosiphonaceae bacterium]